ncbi:mitochondrial tRNA methylthiotransferase CDK5RAP1-like isoform X2 [Anser cygnoides]|uniref:mitochondrial tRNA methylthiotransferase CDK5RAP1-like isoform X2 n=1 Tax=Anser cygnoides TaxID=8845 RepID=UPI0034D2DB00
MPGWGRVLRAAGRLRSVAASPGAARGASRGPGERPGGRGAALPAGPDLRHFLRAAAVPPPAGEPRPEPERGAAAGPGTVYLETYGCQMNVNDTEIAWAILQKNGYTRTKDVDELPISELGRAGRKRSPTAPARRSRRPALNAASPGSPRQRRVRLRRRTDGRPGGDAPHVPVPARPARLGQRHPLGAPQALQGR